MYFARSLDLCSVFLTYSTKISVQSLVNISRAPVDQIGISLKIDGYSSLKLGYWDINLQNRDIEFIEIRILG